MLNPLDLVKLALLLAALLVLQRGLQREVQVVFLLLTRRADISIMLFSLLFFPGVLLHELSHYLTALVLGVRTGRLSLFPRPMPNGRLQLGYVETAPADWLRDTLVGAAPLITGALFVGYAGLFHLGFVYLWDRLVQEGPATALNLLPILTARPDFWLWFYLAFTVSSTMLPSASDRRAWLPLGLCLALLIGASLLAGAGPWMIANFASPLQEILQALMMVMGITIFIHALLILPFWGLHRTLSRLTGLDAA